MATKKKSVSSKKTEKKEVVVKNKKGKTPLAERWKPSKPGTQRRAVHDLYADGVKPSDIAKKLGISIGNVSGHISNYREGNKLTGTDKTIGKGGAIITRSAKKEQGKKKSPVAKKKAAKATPKKKVAAKAKK